VAKETKVNPYSFEPSLERALALFSCSRQRFWGRVGRVLDPDAMGTEAAKLALRAAREIFAETGNGPESCAQVEQRLRSWVTLGRVTQESVHDVGSLLLDTEDEIDAGRWTEESAVAEAVKILRPRLEQQALVKGMSEWSARGDLVAVAEELIAVSRVGDADSSAGQVFGPTSIVPSTGNSGLKTGIGPLDDALGGGTQRGELCVVAGGSGDGKSMFLNQVQAQAMLQGKFVGYATLEVSPTVLDRRLAANLTAIQIDVIKDGTAIEKVRRSVGKMRLGTRYVKEFTAHATTVSDLREWVRTLEQQERRRLDVLIVDYADLLIAPKRHDDGYHDMKEVFTALRAYARDRDIWLWTAAQTQRKKDKQKKVTGENVADSLHKLRIPDTMVTLNYDEETKDIELYLAKGRDIEGKKTVCTLPAAFDTGMVVPVSRHGANAPPELGDEEADANLAAGESRDGGVSFP